MKKHLKENYIIYISIIILLGIVTFNLCNYLQSVKQLEKEQLESEKICSEVEKSNEKYSDYCKISEENKNMTLDFYTMFTNVIVLGFSSIVFIMFLFVSLPALSYICKFFKNNIIKTELQRSSYKNIISKLILKSYKSVFIIPVVIIFAMIICALYTKNFNPEYAIFHSSVAWSLNTMKSPVFFLVIYIIQLFLYSSLYINICLCIARKYHNYFVAIILSFLVLIGLEALLEIGINTILFGGIIKSDFGYLFNIISIFTLPDAHGVIWCIIIPLGMVIMSGIAVYLLYRNSEKLIIDCERNE